MKYPVSTATKRYLDKIGEDCIGYGFIGWLEDIYNACYPHKRNRHVLDKWQVVLNALDRERKAGCDLFERSDFLTPSSRWARIFTLKTERGKLNL